MGPAGHWAAALSLCAAVWACGSSEGRSGQTDGGVSHAAFLGPWQVQTDTAALPRGAPGAWDDGLIDPGAMIYHGGRFHSLYNAIRSWPTPLSVGYATSAEGEVWVRQVEVPVYDGRSVPRTPWSIRANSVLVENDRWILYFSASAEPGNLHGWIGRATAESPTGPWTTDTAAVLEAGVGGAWSGRAVGDAKVAPIAEGYALYFTGIDASGMRRVGRAVSADLGRWTVSDTPVLEPGPDGAWDAEGVSDPSVARAPDGAWVMVYRGRGELGTGLGWARSGDGIRWQKDPEPFVHSEGSPWSTIYFSAMIALRDRHYVYFEATDTPDGGTQVYAAWRDVRLER